MAREDAASGERLSIAIDASTHVSARWLLPPAARAGYVLAHGAGAGMEQPFLRAAATELAALGIATLRFQFPYAEHGSRRPDAPRLCHATVRAAVAAAQQLAPELPLFAGGRSFGGRMTSQAQALAPLSAVRGLVFLGFPLHPAGQPAQERAEHLLQVADPDAVRPGHEGCARRTHTARGGTGSPRRAGERAVGRRGGSFLPRARAHGMRDAPVRAALLAAAAAWMARRS